MSPSIKLGLLSLVSAAVAVPHSGAGGHSRFHSKSAGTGTGTGRPAYPTGGWSGSHNHTHIGHTASGAGKHTTIIDTIHSTETVVSTVYATRPGAGNGGPNSVGAAGASSGGAAGACGPATVYVTATNKVTVTVPAGGAPASSAAGSSAAGSAAGSSPASVASSAGGFSALPVGPVSSSNPSVGGGYGTTAAAQAAPSSSSAAAQQLPSVSITNPKKEGASVPVAVPSSQAAAPSSKAAVSSAASSAAKPSASSSTGSSGGYSGKKRGLAYTAAGDLSKFGAGKFGFAYNWNPQPNGNMPSGVEFIPTVHPLTGSYATPENYQSLIAKQSAKTLFTFNEPDKGDQANIQVGDFCNQWDKWVTPIINANPSLTVVAPSVSNGNETGTDHSSAPVGLWYLEQVKSQCSKAAATWKEINIHFYDNWDSDTINRFKTYYQRASDLNKGKNIWVTELNLNVQAGADYVSFLKDVTSFLDSQSNCAGYSWFKVGSETARELLKADGSLSECGAAYVS